MLAGGGLVVLAIAIALILRHMGAGTLQDWIGTQLQDIANSYLNPKLSFTDLAYEYPLTVSLKNLHLTADDPANPGHAIDIIACQRATVALAEIPSIGKPIVIQKIILDQPLISAVAVEPRSKQFVGFSDLVRGGASGAADEKSSGPPKKLSDVFQMRLVQITDGRIVYDPRIGGTVPMTLDQINTVLNIEPADAGWYKLDTVIARKPVFELQLAGQLNLDSFSVRGVDIKLLADLGRDKLDYLPPELQAMLKQYDARGKLNVEVTGSMPIMDPMKGRVEAIVKLDRANFAMGGLRIPVDNLDLDARFADGKADLPSLKIAALGGWADLSGSATLNERLDADLHLKVAGMVLEQLLANPALASGSPARLDLDFNFAGSVMSILGKAPAKPGAPLASIGVKDFRISADDPMNPGEKIDVAACKSLDVAMTEPMVSGKPIVIDKIIFDRPELSAVAVAPGATRFVGVPDLPSSASAGPSAPMPKLGDLLRVKTFQLKRARIIYDPRIPGTQRMCLDPINTSLNVDPKDPGSYRVSTNISRKPAFSLAIDGEINIDDPGVQNLNLDLQADLTQEPLDFLPPQLQLILKQTRARGRLSVKAGASVAMSDLARGKAHLDVDARNIELSQGNIHIPVDDVSISARLQDGKVQQTIRIAALNNVFDLSGSVALNNRLDTDTTLTLKDVELEPLLAALKPNQPAPKTSTKLSAAIEVQSPLMVAMGAVPGTGNEPAASVTVRDFRLTADDPRTSGQGLDFAACDRLGVKLSALPGPGKPIAIDSVVVEHPALRAIAVGPESRELAGFSVLGKLLASRSPPATVPSTTLPSTAPTEPAPRLSDVFRLRSLSVSDASLYYDPRIDGTVPLSLNHIMTKIGLDSAAGDAYRFDLLIPSKPDLNLELAGRFNVDTMVADGLKLNVTARVGANLPKYLPPQLQKRLGPYDPAGSLALKVTGTLPVLNPAAGDIEADLLVDGLAATAGGYRIPIDHLRLPIRLKGGRVEIQDAAKLGGPMLETLGGEASLTGTVTLNERLDSTLTLTVDRMLLQTLMADKISEPRKNLIGAVHAYVELKNAPLRVIAAKATSRPAADSASSSPLSMADLPANWGSGDIELTQARLVGFELIQGMDNIARSAFADIFNRADKDKPQTVVPKESADVVCTFDRDHISISNLHYDGEDLAADGKGYVTLKQEVNLDLTGGPMSKLGGLGSVGNWIESASDSLLYYHVSGRIGDLKIEPKRGNGRPIVEGAKEVTQDAEKITKKGVKAVGTGLDKAGSFIHGLFNHKDQDQDKN